MLRFFKNVLMQLMMTVCLVTVGIFEAGDCSAQASFPLGKKVLVVMSYHQGYQGGEKEIKVILDELLESAEVRYFYLDTKRDLQAGTEKAKQAYEVFLQFKPDAVIAANDNAQALFVVPYLKDKTEVPVIFCGVNDDATKYGYPASNVSGVIEKKHYRESLELLQVIDASAKKLAVIYRDNPTNETNVATLKKDIQGLSLEIAEFRDVRSTAELQEALDLLKDKVDALVLLNLTGITDGNGGALEAKDAVAFVAKKWMKPTVAAGSWEIEAGALCGVIQVDKEQGYSAAQMLFDLWAGRKITDLHIIENSRGRSMINKTTAERLGLKIKPGVLLSVKTVN